MWEYKASVVKVVDGDTVDFDLDLGFYLKLRVRLRLAGIDTPEVRGAEKEEGLRVKAFVERLLGGATDIVVRTGKETGKFGRWIGTIFLKFPDGVFIVEDKDGELTDAINKRAMQNVGDTKYLNLNELLIIVGYAKPYEG